MHVPSAVTVIKPRQPASMPRPIRCGAAPQSAAHGLAHDRTSTLPTPCPTPTLPVQCHPFASGRYMFMHNGIIAGFSAIRRKLLDGLSDSAYDAVPSFHSDSAVSFALFLSFLPDMDRPQPPDVILQALQRTLQFIGEKHAEAGLSGSQGHTSLLNFVVTDGNTLIATCCVSPESDKPASLYYAEGTTFRCCSPPLPFHQLSPAPPPTLWSMPTLSDAHSHSPATL